MCIGREDCHAQPELGDDDMGGVASATGDLVKAVHCRQRRVSAYRSRSVPGSAAWSAGDDDDELVDADYEAFDLRSGLVRWLNRCHNSLERNCLVRS